MRFLGALLVGMVGCAASAGAEQNASSAADITASADTCPADSAPRALMNEPMKDPDDAAARLGCLATVLTAQHDGRAPFATLYTAITVTSTASRRHDFQDGAWTAHIFTEFAELYRKSGSSPTSTERPIAGSWRIAFDAAKESKTLIGQDMSLGVNAHVDHDLAHALLSVGIGSGDTRAMRQRDHFRVNDILHANVETALTKLGALYAPGLAEAPSAVMTLLSDVYFRAVEAARLKAWVDAVALTQDELDPDGVADEIEGTSTVIDAILVPSIDPAIDAKLHAIEQGQ